jgi:hypothetical protein
VNFFLIHRHLRANKDQHTTLFEPCFFFFRNEKQW